jgi:hypothetical protein
MEQVSVGDGFFIAMILAAVATAPVTAGLSQVAIHIAQMERGAYRRNVLAAVPVNLAVSWIVFGGLVAWFAIEQVWVAFASFLPAGIAAFVLDSWLLRLADGSRVSRASARLAAGIHAVIGAPLVGFVSLLFLFSFYPFR